MRRLFFILGFLLLSALPLYGVVGCGPGTDNSDCGNVGDPYEGGAPPGGTELTACGTLAAGTAYYITADLGSDPTVTCLTLAYGGHQTLDLRGHTLTGRIWGTINLNGLTIFNGSVNCSIAGDYCIHLSSDSNYTAKTRLHHLTPHNSVDPGTIGMAAVLASWTGLDGTNLALEVDHITCYVGTAPNASRSGCLRIGTGKKTDILNNDLTCNADTKACNLIEVIPEAGYVNGLIHNNKVTITTNTVSQGVPRAIAVSGPDSGSTGTQGWQVYSNYCTANNGRCFRFRQVNDLLVHDNEVVNCAATMGYGCYHFGDPSNGTEYVGDAQAVIYNETIALDTGGVAFWLRDGNGWTVKNSTVTGTHGKLGSLLTPSQAPPGGPVPTSATFCGIAGAAGLDVNSTAAASTTVHVYLAGTWTGAGTIDNMGSCPGVGGSPLVLLSPITLNFSAQVVGTTSGAQTITLSNPGDNTLNITSIVASTTSAPTSPGDFNIASTTCGATLAAAASCAVNVSFTPVAGGSRTGRIRFTTDAATSPDDVSTSGTGQIVLTLRGGTFRISKN
jgi:hypothetical protein